MDEPAAAGLRRSIKKFGDLSGIVWNAQLGKLVCGHQRVARLQEQFGDLVVVPVDQDWAEIQTKSGKFPVRVVRWAEHDHRVANVTANNGQIQGEFDETVGDFLLAIADAVRQEDESLLDDLRLTELLLQKHEPEELDDVEPKLDQAEELAEKWQTAPGQVWTIYGRRTHRLCCGDSTRADHVDKLLNGRVPFMMVTDPPYGVDYDPEWRHETGLNNSDRIGKVANDSRADWTDTYSLFSGDVAYVWHDGRYAGLVAANLYSCDLHVRAQIIWVKPAFAISRGHYHWQHEPCWYAVRKGSIAKWNGDRKQSTCWQITNKVDKDEGETQHGTQKPIECMGRPIRNHGGRDDAVYDPFLGSGTTMLAADQLERECYGMELLPKYVAVILQRMTDAGMSCKLEID